MPLEKFVTPKGKCEFIYLQKPNIDPEGVYRDRYKINFIIDKSNKEHMELAAHITKLFKATKGEYNPLKPHLDKEKKPTGYGVVTFASNYEYPDGTKRGPIPTVDSKGNKIERPDNFVGHGSVVRVNWSATSFSQNKGGLSLILNGVQIIELVEYENTVEFSEEEGYVAEKEEPLFSGNPDPRKKSALEEETSLPKNLW